MEGIELKVLRIRAGLTQHEAGLIIDVPSYEVSRLEAGRGTVPPEKVEALRAALTQRAGERA